MAKISSKTSDRDPTSAPAADPGNAIKDPEDWTTGDEPMTGAQASYLKTLCDETGEVFDGGLSKAEASQKIDELRRRDPRLSKTSGSGKASP
jgi:Protein of unknown function (DUF3072)